MDDVLVIAGLRKRYGKAPKGVQANDGVDLRIGAGQVVGLLGHNGAGKTTLVNQVVGLALPDEGSITLAGIDAIARPDEARKLASVQAQANVPITGLTPRRAIDLVGRLRGLEEPEERDLRVDHHLLAAGEPHDEVRPKRSLVGAHLLLLDEVDVRQHPGRLDHAP